MFICIYIVYVYLILFYIFLVLMKPLIPFERTQIYLISRFASHMCVYGVDAVHLCRKLYLRQRSINILCVARSPRDEYRHRMPIARILHNTQKNLQFTIYLYIYNICILFVYTIYRALEMKTFTLVIQKIFFSFRFIYLTTNFHLCLCVRPFVYTF